MDNAKKTKIRDTEAYSKISPFWKIQLSFAGSILIALCTALYYLINWASSSSSVIRIRYDWVRELNWSLHHFKAPQVVSWQNETHLAIHYQFVPLVICLIALLSVLFFLHILARTLSLYSIHTAQEDGREVMYVSTVAEKWSSEIFRLASTITIYAIVAMALSCIYIFLPYMTFLFAILKLFVELARKSLQLLPDMFSSNLAGYVIGGVLGSLSYFTILFPYQVSLYGISRLVRIKLPSLSNIFRHLTHKPVKKDRGESLARIFFYLKDFFLRFSIMYVLYTFLIAGCLLLLTDVFSMHSVKLNLDTPIYRVSAPSEVSSTDHSDDIGVLTVYLSGLVNGDVHVKIIPEHQHNHYEPVDTDTYTELSRADSFFGSDIFGYRFCFPLKSLLECGGGNFIIDVLVGRGAIGRNYLRFQESFKVIDRKSAENVGKKDAAVEAVKRGFERMEDLVRESDRLPSEGSEKRMEDLIRAFDRWSSGGSEK